MTIDAALNGHSETRTTVQTTAEQWIYVVGPPRFELGTFGPPDRYTQTAELCKHP